MIPSNLGSGPPAKRLEVNHPPIPYFQWGPTHASKQALARPDALPEHIRLT